MRAVYFPKNEKGWTYYIDSYFAWIPTYCQGQLCWLRRVWYTWPEDEKGPIMSRDVLPEEKMLPNQQMYLVEFPYDPRTR